MTEVIEQSLTPRGEEGERAAIVQYLTEEADDCVTMDRVFADAEIGTMMVMRAAYYRQAASFIRRGEHHRADRPRPTADMIPPGDHDDAQEALQGIKNMLSGYAGQPNLLGDVYKIADAASRNEQEQAA